MPSFHLLCSIAPVDPEALAAAGHAVREALRFRQSLMRSNAPSRKVYFFGPLSRTQLSELRALCKGCNLVFFQTTYCFNLAEPVAHLVSCAC